MSPNGLTSIIILFIIWIANLNDDDVDDDGRHSHLSRWAEPAIANWEAIVCLCSKLLSSLAPTNPYLILGVCSEPFLLLFWWQICIWICKFRFEHPASPKARKPVTYTTYYQAIANGLYQQHGSESSILLLLMLAVNWVRRLPIEFANEFLVWANILGIILFFARISKLQLHVVILLLLFLFAISYQIKLALGEPFANHGSQTNKRVSKQAKNFRVLVHEKQIQNNLGLRRENQKRLFWFNGFHLNKHNNCWSSRRPQANSK